jgi:sugar transferase EpsL
MYRRFLKRLLDFLISLTALLLLWPIILICMLAVRLSSPGPAIFRQRRLGFHGKEFTMLKLRTMKVKSEHTGSGVYSGKDDARVTRVGKILRATSIDELPQCINVLRGDMALIGPRPPLTYHPWPY